MKTIPFSRYHAQLCHKFCNAKVMADLKECCKCELDIVNMRHVYYRRLL